MNRTRVAALLRELADELERDDERQKVPVRAKMLRKRVRHPFVPQRELSEIEIARARQRARKLGIPIP